MAKSSLARLVSPSAKDAVVGFYEVRLGTAEVCECANFKHRGEPCKHIHAAILAQSKSATCSCCGQRVLDRFLSEVTEVGGSGGRSPTQHREA